MKQKYTCKNCKYCCPFLNGNLGNCGLDMKEIDIEKDRCKKFKLLKEE